MVSNFIIHSFKKRKEKRRVYMEMVTFLKKKGLKVEIADCLFWKKMFPFLTGTGTRVSGNILEGGKWVGTF
jgi:hypothetical protein